MSRRALALLLLAASMPAFAADSKKKKGSDDKKDDLDDVLQDPSALPEAGAFEEEKDENDVPIPAAPKLEEDGDEPPQGDPEDDEFKLDDNKDDDIDFRDEDDAQGDTKPRGPGEDTAALYRAAKDSVKEALPQEELIVWEEYLQKYPKSLFRDRVETRMDELSASLFDERVPGSDRGGRLVDAGKREIDFASPLHLPGIDPHSRLSAGMRMGSQGIAALGYLRLGVDYEHAFTREWSVHGSATAEGGPLLAVGSRYALIKSARTNSVLSAGLDFNLSSVGALGLGLQPNIGFGQRFDVKSGLDVYAVAGGTFFVPFGFPPAWRWLYGLGAEFRPSEVVYLTMENSLQLQYTGADEHEAFVFGAQAIGMKFRVKKPDSQGRNMMMVGANVGIPYMRQYWSFYVGAIGLTFDWML